MLENLTKGFKERYKPRTTARWASLFVHNRVESIHTVAQYLQNLLPNARIAVAHGQMNENEQKKLCTILQ